jgi:REP element-mobilizing transposase RayT
MHGLWPRKNLEEDEMERDSLHKGKPLSDQRVDSQYFVTHRAYFITICAMERDHFFAVPAIEAILRQQWHALSLRFSQVKLDSFMIMPNHVHFILWLQRGGKQIPKLSVIVQAYKSCAGVEWIHYLKENKVNANQHIGQKGYYDSLVRDLRALKNIRHYIYMNPIVAQARETPIWQRRQAPKQSN